MRHNRLATLLALAGLAGGSIGVQTAQASMAAHSAAQVSAAASKGATITATSTQRQSPKTIKGRFGSNHGGFDNSPAKNQRIKRKNQRRAWASGDKKAFN